MSHGKKFLIIQIFKKWNEENIVLKEPLALVGMSCRLPGGDGLDEFWELVARGATAWGSLSEDRLNRDLYFARRNHFNIYPFFG